MGLGPIIGIYQARFNRYLEDRGLKPVEDEKVWVFVGDGESDEPESLGAIALAARERLDNLIFVVNCNLQRLDGPVRGNGQIIQELEADLPRCRLARDQGRSRQRLGPVARQRQGRSARSPLDRSDRRRRAEVRGRVGRLRTRAFLGQGSGAAAHGRAPLRRAAQATAARRARSDQSPRSLQGGRRSRRRADRDPRAHDQGLRSRRERRRQEHHAPAEEAQRGRAP